MSDGKYWCLSVAPVLPNSGHWSENVADSRAAKDGDAVLCQEQLHLGEEEENRIQPSAEEVH